MLDKDFLIRELKKKNFMITAHAISRMHERNINVDDIYEIIELGEIIEIYQDDYPNPSCLLSGVLQNRPIHVVCSFSSPIFIITAYEPNEKDWEKGNKKRRKV